jgi:hypothetical protein
MPAGSFLAFCTGSAAGYVLFPSRSSVLAGLNLP